MENDKFTLKGDAGACPYSWPIGDRHILLFFSHMSGGQYLLGDYDQDRGRFVVTHGAKFNFGAWGPGGVHAPSATPDGKGGVIVIFNMNPAKPRRLTLRESDELGVEPVGDVESLRGAGRHIRSTALPANQEVILKGVEGKVLTTDRFLDQIA